MSLSLGAGLAPSACGDDPAATADTATAADTATTFDTATDTATAADVATATDTTAATDASTATDTVDDATVDDTVEDATAADVVDVTDTSDAPDATTPPPVTVSRTHWRLTFDDDFRGKPASDARNDYCFDTLEPQCHIWAGASHDCDQVGNPNEGPYPPTRENMIAAVKTLDPNHDFASMSREDVRALYGQLVRDRMADLDKCHWTLYEMVNWMATDYAGRWSARFDATQVAVDARGKGYLRLSATYAPVEACLYGGSGSPNCQVYGFEAGRLDPNVHYWADPNPAWPGVYYAPRPGQSGFPNQGCRAADTFSGVNCTVVGFAAGVLQPEGVTYWVDADPRWPGVYYSNQTYACRDNIQYEPNLEFHNLTCPILDGGVMSYAMTNEPYARGAMQYHGRFEAKARIPKGLGAFPATWLMPETGGWPYDGGEIDVLEARDNADEVYQTYHTGKCYDGASGLEMDATDPGDCTRKGGKNVHLSKGYTQRQRKTDEFWRRDHLFAAEWIGDHIVYSINNVVIGDIKVGMTAQMDPADAPSGLAPFEASNFPTSPFYWILNHSTWVAPEKWASFAQETFLIDYVRNWVACGTDNAEYCPDGGVFHEGVGCVDGAVTKPSPCQPSARECVNGGTRVGSRCLAYPIAANVLHAGTTYWIDTADPAAAGIFYFTVNGGCPYGGEVASTGKCRLVSLPGDLLESGIDYVLDTSATQQGIYYTPDFMD